MSTQGPHTRLRSVRRDARLARLLLLLAVAMCLCVHSASASPVINEFSMEGSTSAAGAHPDITLGVRLDKPAQPEVARDLTFHLPEGVFGNPGAIFKCRAADFAVNTCEPGSQAGLITVFANYSGNPKFDLGTAPIYNLQTVDAEETARLAFMAPTVNIPVTIPISVRSASDYSLEMKVFSISQTVALSSAQVKIWGVPAAPVHDTQRFPPGGPGDPPGCPGEETTSCNTGPFPSAGIVPRPFVDNPSVCTGEPLPISLDVTSYQDPGHQSHEDAFFPETTNCENQRFDPFFNLGLTTGEGDAPSGLDIRLVANQFLEGEAPSPSTLRSGSLTLPEGLTINPDAADGQRSCSDEQAHFGTNLPAECPDNSKIGTMEVHTPALDGPLIGSLYIGEPKPGDQYRVFMVFNGFGIHAKLFASFLPDPKTGQVTVNVDDIPQVPFEEFDLHLFASDRGLMATPTRCGIYGADALLTGWNGTVAPQHLRPNVSIRTGPHGTLCPGQRRPFDPRLVAGTSNPVAGDFSSFTLKLDRDDGDQFLGDLTFRMPPGFTGDLGGISYCPEAAITASAQNLGRAERAHPSCPSSSQIGTTNVAAGPGEHPFHAVGKMYLSGPFKGAPLSLVAVTPALAGPYDYGVVVVRVALHVDPETAQVFAASDTVPSIIGGIPIRMRSIQVNIDKPEFTINPTNCSPFTVDSQGIGDQGTVTDFSSYFQVVNCARLPFQPKMTVKQVGSRKSTRRASNPTLQFDLTTRPGDANVKSLSVTLSSAFEIDQEHLGNLCTEKELVATQCAGRQQIGEATTETPLLDQPLSGPVYAVSGSGGLPRLAFVLDGQVDLLPRADAKTVKGGRLKTTVPVVPDAPIGHFHLTVFGGKHGYLANTRDLCVHTPLVKVSYTGQNGRAAAETLKVKSPCGGSSARHKRHRG